MNQPEHYKVLRHRDPILVWIRGREDTSTPGIVERADDSGLTYLNRRLGEPEHLAWDEISDIVLLPKGDD